MPATAQHDRLPAPPFATVEPAVTLTPLAPGERERVDGGRVGVPEPALAPETGVGDEPSATANGVQKFVPDPVPREPALSGADTDEALREIRLLRQEVAELAARADVHDQLSTLSDQIAALAEVTAGVVGGDIEVGKRGEQGVAEEETEAAEGTERQGELLKQAARISSASLVCHRDVWEFVAGQAGSHPHFRMPPQLVDRGEGRVSVQVSGRSLIAVPICLFDTHHAAGEGDGDWALALTTYRRIDAALASLTEDGQPVTIVLDDRAAEDDAQNE